MIKFNQCPILNLTSSGFWRREDMHYQSFCKEPISWCFTASQHWVNPFSVEKLLSENLVKKGEPWINYTTIHMIHTHTHNQSFKNQILIINLSKIKAHIISQGGLFGNDQTD